MDVKYSYGRHASVVITLKKKHFSHVVSYLGHISSFYIINVLCTCHVCIVVIENFVSPHTTCLDGLSISLCRPEVPFCTSQSQKIICFHIYMPCQLYRMCICRLHHYNPHTSRLVLKIKNCARFHVMS
jgi:hypothetical protein